MTKLENLFVALVNMDIFQMTLKGRTWQAVVHGNCYVIITVYLHTTQPIPAPGMCLLRGDHHGPRLNKSDQI